MKKILIAIFLSLLFCSCKNEIENWICISVETDKDTVFHEAVIDTPAYITTKRNKELTLNYFLRPESSDFITISNIYSTNTEVLSIESIDKITGVIKVRTLNIGEAQIIINTKSNGNTSTVVIYVK